MRVSRTGEQAEQPPGSIGPDARVATADEWLRVERLREGGRTVRPEEVLRTGYRFEVGLPT